MGEKRTIILTSTFFNDLRARSAQNKNKNKSSSFPSYFRGGKEGKENERNEAAGLGGEG